MQNGKPYILFCAGEDSGDCIGEGLVKQAVAACDRLQTSFEIRGAGGIRMQNAGMLPLVDFETLPVSGFGDVLPKYFALRRSYKVLESALKSDLCAGLVAVDYPGFNMKLVAQAKKLNKPVLYVAPPQIWAWKSYRAKLFAGCSKIQLATFFDFEVEAYRLANCNVVKTIHPFAQWTSALVAEPRLKKILLLPGSRKSQALRNIPVFLKSALSVVQDVQFSDFEIVILAARKSLVSVFENAVLKATRSGNVSAGVCKKISVQEVPASTKERCRMYSSMAVSLSAPGTATLELALSNCPTVVCTKPDFLTLQMAKRFVKTEHFALPNLLLQKKIFPEYISRNFDSTMLAQVSDAIKKMTALKPSFSKEILEKLNSDYNSEKLMSEFLAQLV